MTLVYGQLYFQGIVLLADSRTTFVRSDRKIVALQDNAQKIFRLAEHTFIAFSGDFEFANLILAFLYRNIEVNQRLNSLHYLFNKAPKILRYAYNILATEKKEKRPVSFMIAGMDHNRPLRDKAGRPVGIHLFDNKLLRISFPGFVIEDATHKNPILVMGSGEPAIEGNEDAFKDFQFGQPILPLVNYAAIIDERLKQKVRELSINTVGGLFQIVTIDLGGSAFHPYQASSRPFSGKMDVELIIDPDTGRYIQRNRTTGKEMPLLLPYEVLRQNNFETKLFALITQNTLPDLSGRNRL